MAHVRRFLAGGALAVLCPGKERAERATVAMELASFRMARPTRREKRNSFVSRTLRPIVLVLILALVAMGSFLLTPVAGAASGFTGPYELQNWTKDGPGNTSITPVAGAATSATFHYDLDPAGLLMKQTWTYKTIAAGDGTASFDWAYSGDHAYFKVQVDLYAFADGPGGVRSTQTLVEAEALTWLTNGFSYSGVANLTVHSGYAFGLIASGSNGDINNSLRGDITLTNFQTRSDVTPPVITPTVTGTLGTNGWYTSDGAVSWTVTDDGSAISSTSGCGPTTIRAETAGTTLTCTATSAGGISSESVTVKRDATAPNVGLGGGLAVGGSYYFGNVPAAPTCTATDATSGLAGPCAVSGYSAAVGTHTVSATATDLAGNTSTTSATYTVKPWTLNGFYQPVDMGGVWNTVKAGSTVPLKFEVFVGSTELTTTAAIGASFSAKQVSCTTSTEDAVEEIVTTGGTSLRYDATAGQFIQNWQTPKKPGACYVATVTLIDGTAISANFKLK